MRADAPVKLRIPSQDLQGFDIFPLSAEAAHSWAQALPVTSSIQVAGQLGVVIARLNRTDIAPGLRLSIMEELRAPLLLATASMSRRFLRQPLALTGELREMAELSQELYKLASTAYTIVAVHAIQRRESIHDINPAQLACEALYRALRFAGAILLQTFQFYQPVAQHRWLALHQLYALADAQQLTELKVKDEFAGGGTVTTAYLQALVLGCCKPNQLRRNDLAAIHRGLQEWIPLVDIKREPGLDLFCVDLDSDRPPSYTDHRAPPGLRARYLNTDRLVVQLKQLADKDRGEGVVFDKDTVASPALLNHLVSCFSRKSVRLFARKRSGSSLWIGLGLSACHYYMAGEKTFEQLLYGEKYVPSLAERVAGNVFQEHRHGRDLWQRANPRVDFTGTSYASGDAKLTHEVVSATKTLESLAKGRESDPASRKRHLAHRVTVFDTSPGGYCLELTKELARDVNIGDIACVKELDGQQWAVSVIRWMTQLDDSKALVGLELLSPSAQPYGARVQQKKGEPVAPSRVLLLPEIKPVGQPPTIITPRAGFKVQQKVVLLRHKEELVVQLIRQVSVTGDFVQFEFNYLKQRGEVHTQERTPPHETSLGAALTML